MEILASAKIFWVPNAKFCRALDFEAQISVLPHFHNLCIYIL
jgi:hypothetical protein